MMLFLMLTGCDLLEDYTRGGVLVGNPGEITLETASSNGVVWENGTMRIQHLFLGDCTGSERQKLVIQQHPMNLVGNRSLELPAGDWCSMTILPEGPMTWEAKTKDGWTLWLELDVPSLTVSSPWIFVTDDRSLVLMLGLPDAVSWDELAPESGDNELFIDATHPAHDDMLYALTNSLTLYDVTGLEGEPGPDDIIAGYNCADCEDTGECGPCGDPPDQPIQSCGAGCGEDYALTEANVLVLPFLGLLGWRRRRRRSVPTTLN